MTRPIDPNLPQDSPLAGTDSETLIEGSHGRAPTQAPRVPKGYLLEATLGRGGMGEVLQALDPQFGRRVAIKTLLAPEKNSVRERFLREARVTGQLEHPNIVPVHELSLDASDGRPFLVMKRVKGRDLGSERSSPT